MGRAGQVLLRWAEAAGGWEGWRRGVGQGWRWVVVLGLVGVGAVCWAVGGAEQRRLVELARAGVVEGRGWGVRVHPKVYGSGPGLYIGTLPRLDVDENSWEVLGASGRYALSMYAVCLLPREVSGKWELITDDGAELSVDGVRVITLLGVGRWQGGRRVSLGPGAHLLGLRYYQWGGNAEIRLRLPAEIERRLVPVGPGVDAGVLWRIMRGVRRWRHRAWLAWAAAGLWVGVMLLPWPVGTRRRVWDWVRARWGIWVVLGALGVMAWVGLGWVPGEHRDEGWVGITAYCLQWLGIRTAPISWYGGGYMVAWAVWALQKILPLTTFTLRLPGLVCNLVGLGLAVVGLEAWAGRRAAVVAAAVVGTSMWFISSVHVAWEITAYTVGCAGLGLWGIALGDRSWVAAVAGGVGLGLGCWLHPVFLPFCLGVGLMLALEGGWRLGGSGRFWAGVGAWGVVSAPVIMELISRGGGGMGVGRLAEAAARAWPSIADVLPGMADGRLIVLWHVGGLKWWVVPAGSVVAGLGLACWWWVVPAGRARKAARALVWLALGCWWGLLCIIPRFGLRYFIPLMLPLGLLGGLVLGVATSRPRLRLTGWGLVVVTVGSAVAGWWVNYIQGFRANFPRPVHFPAPLVESSMHFAPKARLYEFLAGMNLKGGVYVPSASLATPLLYRELADTGQRGLEVLLWYQRGWPRRAAAAATYNKDDWMQVIFEGKRRAHLLGYIARATRSRLVPVALPKELAVNYTVFILDPGMRGE